MDIVEDRSALNDPTAPKFLNETAEMLIKKIQEGSIRSYILVAAMQKRTDHTGKMRGDFYTGLVGPGEDIVNLILRTIEQTFHMYPRGMPRAKLVIAITEKVEKLIREDVELYDKQKTEGPAADAGADL